MKCLTLIRHAKAAPATSSDQDWDRPLEKSGERDAAEMGHRLKNLQNKPGLVLASPAIRAARTAQIICAALKIPPAAIRKEERLYLASPTEFRKVIQELGGDAHHLMIFGHNPGISEFADQLASQRRIDNMPTCGIVTATFAIKSWAELELGTAKEIEFDYPANVT